MYQILEEVEVYNKKNLSYTSSKINYLVQHNFWF